MFLSPKIWGCKYTNYFLFINKKPEFQHLDLLITLFLNFSLNLQEGCVWA